MSVSAFSEEDIKVMELMGISLKDVESQIEMFKKGAPYLKLDRPCTIGDGIRSMPEEEAGRLVALFQDLGPKRGLAKFVPASGAASRMFKILLRCNRAHGQLHRGDISSLAQEGDEESLYLLTFMDHVQDFAFYNDLVSAMGKDGMDAEALLMKGQFKEIVDYLLTAKGLGYAQWPKGLLPFHSYGEGTRTAFEEHLVEAMDYVRDDTGLCRLHFTVSKEHRARFQALWKAVGARYEKELGVRFQVDFSVQEQSTDTIAVDQGNRPFRLRDGSLLFRPAGHGALIENLNHLKGDIVFIKNIDNVVPDSLKGHTSFWKKVLGGCLMELQQRIFSYLKSLTSAPADETLLDECLEFADKELSIRPARGQGSTSHGARQDYLVSILNRPLRVCGVVRNQGEPGGGPFWVQATDCSLSLQVAESVEVDPLSEEQKEIQGAATHFNPVDIVCALRDFRGRPFDLKAYVDNEAFFISEKSKDGRALKALELPGLWNGAMAHWNTVFVEVPVMTFNPVKTVNDLLRKEHQ
ncbi:MAG: DUF4301 family protein [Thermodesulfobacteriota bacterium]|nr:DUF4301 family protein [Thermodesulfobacteriota bacterium]